MEQKVLIIGKVWPEPDSSAAGSRMMQLIACLIKQNWQLAFASAANKSPYTFSLNSLGIEEIIIALNDASFDTFIKDYQPNIVIFDRFTTEEQFAWRVAENSPNSLRILDTEDLHCLRAARQTAVKQNKEFKNDDLNCPIAYREIASIYRSDLSLIISEFEYNLLIHFFKVDKALLLYLPFMVETLNKTEINELPNFEERSDFISIGNFLHEPNWDVVLYLKNAIWPLIRKELPKAQLLVYGAYPSHKVNNLNNIKEGFCIKGRAQNIPEVMRQAKVLLAPLRFGAGLKGKFIDGMSHGLPNVTTSIGAEAMHRNIPWCGDIQNDPAAFAKSAINLYRHKENWEESQKNGFQILESVYSKTIHEKSFISTITLLLNNLKAHRLHNFTGAMLMQQTTQSSKYMSLWIETKNKLSK